MEYCLNKAERKLVKLQKKAEKCITREKAVKILNKATKYENIRQLVYITTIWA